MRGPTVFLGLLVSGLCLLSAPGRAQASFATPTQIQDIYTPEQSYATGTLPSQVLPVTPLQTDFGPGTKVNTGSATLINDPFHVQQFDASKYSTSTQTAVLTEVVVSLSYQFQNQVQMTFITASTSTVTANGVMHLNVENSSGQTVLSDIVNTPTFWTQKTLSYPSQLTVSSYTQPLNQALTVNSISAKGYTDSSTLSLFTGTSTLSMPVIAMANSSYTNSSGNGAGGSITTAYAALAVTYYFDLVPVPEPTSLCLTGLGAIGLCLASRVQNRRQNCRQDRAAA